VFDLKPMSAGFVANPGTSLVKIVPQDSLVAKVFISNKDIGFVKLGMEVSVKLDSFPSQEFGDVKGELVWIGSDALPPEQARPYYHFPAKVRLKKTTLRIGGQEMTLQSGMSFNSTIKIRDRSVLSIFTGALFQQKEELKLLR
jgi:hemolysin D